MDMPIASPPILDADAIGELFKREGKALCGWLMRKVRSQSIAEEIVQDTFVKALRHASGFRGDSTPKTWIYAIALNTMRNRFNEMVPEEEFDSIEEVGMPDSECEDVLDVIERNRRLEAISKAWGKLPEEYRTILQFIVVDGMDYEGTAQELGIPLGTVRSRVHRARAMLKEESQKNDVVSRKGIEMFQEKRKEIAHQGKKKTKIELAIDCIRKNGGRASDDAVRAAMCVVGKTHLSVWLSPSLHDGRIKREGREWVLGSTQIPAAPVLPVAETPAPAPVVQPPLAPITDTKPASLPELPAFLDAFQTKSDAERPLEQVEMHADAEQEEEAACDELQGDFTCALWSDGELTMMRDGEALVVLTVEETKILCKYLDRILTTEEAT